VNNNKVPFDVIVIRNTFVVRGDRICLPSEYRYPFEFMTCIDNSSVPEYSLFGNVDQSDIKIIIRLCTSKVIKARLNYGL
jgi:hypothetical protein